jgi:hypothetical protein
VLTLTPTQPVLTLTPTQLLLTNTPTRSVLTGTPSLLVIGTPEMPVTGGQASGPGNEDIVAILLAGMAVLLFVSISLVIRQSARTNKEK